MFQRWDTLIQCASIITIPQADAGPVIEEFDDELLAFDERSTYAALDLIESMPQAEVYGLVMNAIQKAAGIPGDAESLAEEMSGLFKALYIMERQKKRIECFIK